MRKIGFTSYDLNRLKGLNFDLNFLEEKLPKAYRKGLTEKDQRIAKREAQETMKKAKEGKVSAKELYKDWDSDKNFRKRGGKVPKSKATIAYQNQFKEKTSSSDTSLKEKSKKSGIAFSILKEVFERGMAAWRSGHRPGVAPQQWAHARVNSFITGVGKARQADEDLWKKHSGN